MDQIYLFIIFFKGMNIYLLFIFLFFFIDLLKKQTLRMLNKEHFMRWITSIIIRFPFLFMENSEKFFLPIFNICPTRILTFLSFFSETKQKKKNLLL